MNCVRTDTPIRFRSITRRVFSNHVTTNRLLMICAVVTGILSTSVSPVSADGSVDRVIAKAAVKPLAKGDAVGAFYVTKVAGAENDGVEKGSELCYRCRYGSRPMVMVFTRQTGGKVPVLVQVLDKAVDANKKSQLRTLVTVMGEDAAKVKDEANQVAEKAGAKIIPVVVAKETATGPVNYKLSKTADVTVVVASDSKVVSTRTFAAESIDIAAVMSDVKRMLK